MALRILQLTDLHVFADAAARLKGIPTRETLMDVVSFIRDNDVEFDHLILTGDHTHDETPAAYQAVKELLAPWLDRFHQVPGNHDDRGVLRDVFPESIPPGDGPITFSFDDDDWRFVGLDSHLAGEVPGEVTEPQRTWFQEQINSRDGRLVALFLHHPPVNVGSVWMDAIALRNAEPLMSIIESTPAVRLVCCGHVHHEFDFPIGSARFVTTPSTGIQFCPKGDTPTFEATAPGYRLLEFEGNRIDTHVVRLPEIRFRPQSD